MQSKNILNESQSIKEIIIKHRRYLHKNAEVGFILPKTKDYVKKQLIKMGYKPIECGKSGIYATIGKKGKTILLRADMDALPLKEEANVDFCSITKNMHACGHDMHTAMLLGAAQLLKTHEKELNGTVKLMFQPAEEILEGATDMINHGILENVNAALMIHVLTGIPLKTGSAIICNPGISSPGAYMFEIKIQGKGCHGSMPQNGIDPLNVAAHTLISLQEIIAREVAISDEITLTIGSINGGHAPNIIPDQAIMLGSFRTFNEELLNEVKKRIVDICELTARTFKAVSSVTFTSGCPSLKNDEELSLLTHKYTKELLGDNAISVDELGTSLKSSGSEDFAYVSQKVPAIMLSLVAGEKEKGYTYPLHHPKVTFDEEALPIGSAIYAYNAIRWLEENK